jgi:hypothetical protein
MKVAMLLAAMDTQRIPVVVTLAHFARAQQINEEWRASLQRVWASSAETAEAALTRRICERLKSARVGMTCHQLTRLLRSKSKETREALTDLEKAGQVVCRETHATNGRKVETWVWCTQD